MRYFTLVGAVAALALWTIDRPALVKPSVETPFRAVLTPTTARAWMLAPRDFGQPAWIGEIE